MPNFHADDDRDWGEPAGPVCENCLNFATESNRLGSLIVRDVEGRPYELEVCADCRPRVLRCVARQAEEARGVSP